MIDWAPFSAASSGLLTVKFLGSQYWQKSCTATHETDTCNKVLCCSGALLFEVIPAKARFGCHEGSAVIQVRVLQNALHVFAGLQDVLFLQDCLQSLRIQGLHRIGASGAAFIHGSCVGASGCLRCFHLWELEGHCWGPRLPCFDRGQWCCFHPGELEGCWG